MAMETNKARGRPVKESGTERMTEEVGEGAVNYAKGGAPTSEAKKRANGT
jgi:hypothetical protein